MARAHDTREDVYGNGTDARREVVKACAVGGGGSHGVTP